MNKQVFSDALLNEHYTLATLANGLKVYLFEKPSFKSSYAIFGTKYGSIDTAFSLNNGKKISVPEGIAHFLEHKLFESEDGDAFTKYAATGAQANAYTSFDRTCYLFSCSNNFEKNLDILLDFVQNPYFTAQTVQKEQGIIGQEIKMYDDAPEWCVLFNMLSAMYHNHAVKIDIAGTVESIAEITDELLYKCYNAFYDPSNMFICIAGNFNLEKTLKKIESGVKASSGVTVKCTDFCEPESIVRPYVEKSLPVSMPVCCFGYKLPATNTEPDIKSSICINLLLRIFADTCVPFHKQLSDLKIINDSFDFELFEGRGYRAAIFTGESSNPKILAEKICERVEEVKKNGIDAEIFQSVLRDQYGSLIKQFNSVDRIVSLLVDSAIGNYAIFDELNILRNITVSDLEKYLDDFKAENTVLSVINPTEAK